MWWIAALAGVATGLLGTIARRLPWLGWLALAPLGLAMALCGPLAALAGALAGACIHGAAMITQPPSLRPLGVGFGALGWGVAAGLGGVLLAGHLPAPFLAVVLPTCAVIAPLPMRWLGAPRWVHSALACSQEPFPVVLRAGWIGGEHTVSALLATASAALILLLPGPLSAPWLAMSLLVGVGAVLGVAAAYLARARRTIARARRVRIAAVVVNGAPPEHEQPDGLWPSRSPEYRDVHRAIDRYAPHVADAAARGAELVVLPEVAVLADPAGAALWLATVKGWAAELGVTMVAPFLDLEAPSNTLCVAEPSGRTWMHDKQHPAPGLEPAPRTVEGPGPHTLDRGWLLSTVLCVDLDYADLIAPVRASGGVLVAPANDWPGGFDEIHDRTATWAAVLTGTTVLRATGHGFSSVRDGAGTLIARASSLDGPVVLVVDAPLR